MFEHRKPLYTVEECCEMLSLSRSSFYEQVRANRITTLKIGRKTLVPAQALDDFIALLTVMNYEEKNK